MKKYEVLHNESIVVGDETLYRIRALVDFVNPHLGKISQGSLGGYIADETCLSQSHTCWIDDGVAILPTAFVGGCAGISGPVMVCYRSRVGGHALIKGKIKIQDSVIGGRAKVSGECSLDEVTIKETAEVQDTNAYRALIKGSSVVKQATISGNLLVIIADNASIVGNHSVIISENAKIMGNAKVVGVAPQGTTQIRGNAILSQQAGVLGEAAIEGNAIIRGSAKVGAGVWVLHDAIIEGQAVVKGQGEILGRTHITDQSRVIGNGFTLKNAYIKGDQRVGFEEYIEGSL